MSRLRARLAAVAAALTVGLSGGAAMAHHVPGHGASEGVRSINSLGGRGGRSQTRLLLLNELVYANTGLAPNVANSTSLYGEYAVAVRRTASRSDPDLRAMPPRNAHRGRPRGGRWQRAAAESPPA